MASITYRSSSTINPEVTIELGRKYNVKREGNCDDVYLTKSLAHDCPLTLAILIRTTGEIVEWWAEFGSGGNTYWCLAHDHKKPLTNAQRRTLAAIHYGTLRPFGIDANLARPVCELAFAGLSRGEAETLGGVSAGTVTYA